MASARRIASTYQFASPVFVAAQNQVSMPARVEGKQDAIGLALTLYPEIFQVSGTVHPVSDKAIQSTACNHSRNISCSASILGAAFVVMVLRNHASSLTNISPCQTLLALTYRYVHGISAPLLHPPAYLLCVNHLFARLWPGITAGSFAEQCGTARVDTRRAAAGCWRSGLPDLLY